MGSSFASDENINQQNQRFVMKSTEDFLCLSQEQIEGYKSEIKSIAMSMNKSEIISLKSMILPPTFTFNVIKIMMMIENPKVSNEITWNSIKKDLLISTEYIQRKLSNLTLDEFEEEQINVIQSLFQSVFKPLGQNIESKSELYGSFVHKVCKLCLLARAIMHGSKFHRNQD